MVLVESESWPFDVPPAAAVVTTTYVTRDRRDILFVAHEFDASDGVIWQFHCGNNDYRPEVLQLVRLDEITALDASIFAVALLPLGYEARRANKQSEWVIARGSE